MDDITVLVHIKVTIGKFPTSAATMRPTRPFEFHANIHNHRCAAPPQGSPRRISADLLCAIFASYSWDLHGSGHHPFHQSIQKSIKNEGWSEHLIALRRYNEPFSHLTDEQFAYRTLFMWAVNDVEDDIQDVPGNV